MPVSRQSPLIPASSPSPAQQLRKLIEAPEILLMPGVFDGFSAKLVEACGFKAGFITGSGVSESRLGWPDVGLMGLAENLDACRVLARSTSIPLLAHGDTGYGNAVNVHYAVSAFEQTSSPTSIGKAKSTCPSTMRPTSGTRWRGSIRRSSRARAVPMTTS